MIVVGSVTLLAGSVAALAVLSGIEPDAAAADGVAVALGVFGATLLDAVYLRFIFGAASSIADGNDRYIHGLEERADRLGLPAPDQGAARRTPYRRFYLLARDMTILGLIPSMVAGAMSVRALAAEATGIGGWGTPIWVIASLVVVGLVLQLAYLFPFVHLRFRAQRIDRVLATLESGGNQGRGGPGVSTLGPLPIPRLKLVGPFRFPEIQTTG